jgi:hypothetical protein
MKTRRLEVGFARILLLALPFGCGPHTTYQPAPPAQCGPSYYVSIPDGGIPDGGADGGFRLDPYQCASYCSQSFGCEIAAADGGSSQIRCIGTCETSYGVGCGRRPADLPPLPAGSHDALARYFEEATYLEAASVHAFQRLARELRHHGAPAPLQAAAATAIRDEQRHTRAMARLARRYGGRPRGPRRGTCHVRPLAELALENAVEGCVRETYGALLAWLQAARAGDAQVRQALAPIAVEETAHAHLAWEVARWVQPRLRPAERRQLKQAQRAVIAQLGVTASAAVSPALVQQAGLPPPALAQRLLRAAERTLWS